MKDTAGNTWTWGYDTAGRQTAATDPDTGTTTTAYDASGRTATVTDANGTATGYQYDTLDRATTVTTTPSGGAAKTLISRTYDTVAKGQLTSATRYNGPNLDQAVTTAYAGYNAAYQPKTVTTTLPSALGSFAASYATTTLYTQDGSLNRQTLPALGGLTTETLSYGYDITGLPASLSNSTGDYYVASAQFNNLGLLASFEQYDKNSALGSNPTAGDMTTYFTWDATTGRLTNQWATNSANGKLADLGKTTYTYTPAGLTTGISTTWANRPGAPTDKQCYAYDYADRLAAAWTPGATTDCNTATAPAANAASVPGLAGPAPYAQTYTYTPGGDRSQVRLYDAAGSLATTEAYTQGISHELKTLTTTPATGAPTAYSFSWNAAGQMTSLAGQTLAYNPDGKLDATTGATTLPANLNPSAANGTPPGATATGNTQRYYAPDGSLVGIVDATGTTALIGHTAAHASTAGTQTATRAYTFSGNNVAQRTASGGTTQLAFVVSDRNNSATTVTTPATATAGITAITRYNDPWGNARGTTQSAVGTGAYTTAPAATRGTGTNDANPAGFGAINGYIAGLADAQTQLTHLGARDLNPVLGAFTSPDPILNPDDPNNFSPYAYAGHSPISQSDPSGLCAFCLLGDVLLHSVWDLIFAPPAGAAYEGPTPADYNSQITASPAAELSFYRPGVTSSPAASYSAPWSGTDSGPRWTGTSSGSRWTRSSSGEASQKPWAHDTAAQTNHQGQSQADAAAEQARARAILKAQNEQLKAASDAATQALGRAATASEARFGGESRAAATGRAIHNRFDDQLRELSRSDPRWQPGLRSGPHRPDGFFDGDPIELKPNSPSGLSAGRNQLRRYIGAFGAERGYLYTYDENGVISLREELLP
ncbi:RHS repeat-associated protein [Sinomonas atrocyanea]|nr:RHS repeat-associated protein [Sinomonas atrocyanea]